jgi:glycosyltransferase involved in cell wall biosynthesis
MSDLCYTLDIRQRHIISHNLITRQPEASAQRAAHKMSATQGTSVKSVDSPGVSIIITTKNSASTLGKALSSVAAQSYQKVGTIEIIVVDNFSTDATCEVARGFGAITLRLGPERTAQFNAGARIASGKYLYRMDSDWILDSRLIEEAVLACELYGYDAIATHNTSDPTISYWSKVRKFERDLYVSDPLVLTPGFFTSDVYRRIGGYDESLVACEEYELHRRMLKAGCRIGRINSKELHIGEPRTLREVVEKHFYYGKTILQYVKTDPADSMKRLSPIRLGFVSNWRKFMLDPSLTLGFVFYSLVRYLSVAAGIVAGIGDVRRT